MKKAHRFRDPSGYNGAVVAIRTAIRLLGHMRLAQSEAGLRAALSRGETP